MDFTHNFIKTDLVKKLKLTAQIVALLMVSVADVNQIMVDTICSNVSYDIQGHHFTSNLRPFNFDRADLILGVDWLRRYNHITFDYQECQVATCRENTRRGS